MKGFLIKDISDSYFDVEVAVRCWERKCRSYYKWDKGLKIFLAFVATMTVGGWLASLATSLVLWIKVLWQVSSIISMGAAIILPASDLTKKIYIAARLREKWSEIASLYHTLWVDIPEMYLDEVRTEYKDIRKTANLASVDEIGIPKIKEELNRECRKEVLKSWGITDRSKNNV